MLCQPSSHRPSSHRLRARRRAGRRNLARRVDRRSYASSCVSTQRVCNEPRPQTQAAVTKVATGFHRGQQFSITALTNGGGTITERYAYTAYGTPTILDASGTELTSSSENNRYTYTGREYDQALSLYHYRARIYIPQTGRFGSRDPIGFEGSKWSLYEYVDENPLRWWDPYGEIMFPGDDDIGSAGGSEHEGNQSESNREKHEDGQARKKRDRGGEKGDSNRDVPRRRPKGHKGPWPPKSPSFLPPFIPFEEPLEDLIESLPPIIERIGRGCRRTLKDILGPPGYPWTPNQGPYGTPFPDRAFTVPDDEPS